MTIVKEVLNYDAKVSKLQVLVFSQEPSSGFMLMLNPHIKTLWNCQIWCRFAECDPERWKMLYFFF